MDRVIQKKKWTPARIGLVAGGAVLALLVVYRFAFGDNRPRLNVELDKLTVSEIKKGDFLEFIPVTGTVEPIQTIFIDAIQGGQIQKIYRESGAMVQKGDPLVALANPQMELDVITRETQTTEQINNIRNTRLNLETNSLSLANQVAEIDYRIATLKPQYERYKELFASGAISKRDYELVAEEYLYYVRRRDITYAAYRRDSLLRVEQGTQLDRQARNMLVQLNKISGLRENLEIRAPFKGQFTSPDLRIGQNITPGQRLGQVDILDAYKARVRVDELYLSRINPGQRGTFEFDGKTYTLEISKVYPTIAEGRFEVDMLFVGKLPSNLRRGQTLHIRLELGNPEQAVLLPMGGFYKDTGGSWVFVLEEGDKRAVRRNVTLGRKNPEFFEVLSGLQPGDRVITSSYENFGTNEVLIFD